MVPGRSSKEKVNIPDLVSKAEFYNVLSISKPLFFAFWERFFFFFMRLFFSLEVFKVLYASESSIVVGCFKFLGFKYSMHHEICRLAQGEGNGGLWTKKHFICDHYHRHTTETVQLSKYSALVSICQLFLYFKRDVKCTLKHMKPECMYSTVQIFYKLKLAIKCIYLLIDFRNICVMLIYIYCTT